MSIIAGDDSDTVIMRVYLSMLWTSLTLLVDETESEGYDHISGVRHRLL